MTVVECQYTLPTCPDDGTYVYDSNLVVLLAETLVDFHNPSDVELAAAENLIEDYALTGLEGWEMDSEVIVDPGWGVFDIQRIGRLSVSSAVMFFAASRLESDVRQLLTRGAHRYVIFCPSGVVPGAPIQVFPVTVARVVQLQRLRNNGSQLLVRFAVNRQPADAVVAAS